MSTIMRIIIFLTLLFVITSNAMAQTPIARANLEADIEIVEQEIADLELFAQMKSAANYIPEQSRCLTYLELAAGYRDELAALNQRYAGRADATYREQAETLLEYNKRAIEEYESCFGSVAAQRFDKIRDAFVYPYDTFVARYNVLSDWYGENTNLAARLGELQRELADLKAQLAGINERGDFIGTLTAVFSDVKIERGGGNPFDATRNAKIYLGDTIITGPKGRTRLEWKDRIDELNAGPTVINIGSNSRVYMEHYAPRFERARTASAQRGIIQLIRGTIRAATQNWGSGSAFSVRSGTSLCGIRGTEVLIEYDDATKISKHWLLHGTADLDLGSVTRQLTPMHVVETPPEGPIKERPFGEAEYAAVSQEDGGVFDLPGVLDATRVVASYHIRRFVNAYVRGDYGVAWDYFDDDTRQAIQPLLNKPDELKEFLIDKNVPVEWELGCVVCTGPDLCSAKVALRQSQTPQEIDHYEWVVRPDGDIWRVTEVLNLDLINYNNANLNCPN